MPQSLADKSCQNLDQLQPIMHLHIKNLLRSVRVTNVTFVGWSPKIVEIPPRSYDNPILLDASCIANRSRTEGIEQQLPSAQ